MWRNTVLRAEFLPGVDGRVSIALLLFMLNMAWWTLGAFAGTCAFFWLIQRRGYSMGAFMRRVRRMVSGDVRQKWSVRDFNRRTVPGDMPVI